MFSRAPNLCVLISKTQVSFEKLCLKNFLAYTVMTSFQRFGIDATCSPTKYKLCKFSYTKHLVSSIGFFMSVESMPGQWKDAEGDCSVWVLPPLPMVIETYTWRIEPLGDVTALILALKQGRYLDAGAGLCLSQFKASNCDVLPGPALTVLKNLQVSK